MIVISELQECYIPAAAALEAECFSDAVSETALREFAGNPCNHYYGAFDEDGTLCGYGGFSQAADEAEILSVAASPARRRQGIGRALMERMLRDAALLGVADVYLEVRASGLPARSLYRALGFQEIGLRRGYYAHPKEDAVLMRLSLKTGGTGTEA